MDTLNTSAVGVLEADADAAVESAASLEVAELVAGLTPPKRIAVDALAIGHTVTRAAELAGRHRTTVCRWIAEDPAFNAALNVLEREAIRLGNIRMMSLIPTAIMMIENALNQGDVRAAYQLLKLALFSKRQIGSMSPDGVARGMQVEKLQYEVMLQKQQSDYQELSEESITRSRDAEHARNWRMHCEAEHCQDAAERTARAAKENPQPQPAAAASQAGATPMSAQKVSQSVASAPAQNPAPASVQSQKAPQSVALASAPTAALPVPAQKVSQSVASGSNAAISTANPGQLPAPKRNPLVSAAARAAAGTLGIAAPTASAASPNPGQKKPGKRVTRPNRLLHEYVPCAAL